MKKLLLLRKKQKPRFKIKMGRIMTAFIGSTADIQQKIVAAKVLKNLHFNPFKHFSSKNTFLSFFGGKFW